MNRAERRRRQKLSKKNSAESGHTNRAVAADSQKLLQQGVALHQSGRLGEATFCYQKVLELQPDNVHALSNLGMAFQGQGKLAEAVLYYEKAISLNPDYAEAFSNLGVVLKDQGKFARSVECLQKAISIQPGFYNAHYNLGLVLSFLGHLDEAVDSYNRALSIRPDCANTLNNLGNILKEQGRLDEAVGYFQKAISILPNFPIALNNLGIIYTDQGRLHDAVALLQKAISLNADFADAFLNLGYTLAELGDLERAKENYIQAIALKPDLLKAIHNLGIVLEARCHDVLTDFGNVSNNGLVSDGLHIPSYDDFAALQPKFKEQSQRFGSIPLELSIIELRVKKILGEKVDVVQQNIMQQLPSVEQNTVIIDQKTAGGARSQPRHQKTMVALVGFGRSGTGLLHSMLDNHPEISTTPGVYASGYFGRGVWSAIASKGIQEAPKQFAQLYRVLFDARDPQKPPSPYISDGYGKGSGGVGVAEGFNKMGANHDTPLQVDRDMFLSNLQKILSTQSAVDHGSFFEHVHNAYDAAIGNDFQDKKIILNHIHQIEPFCTSNLIKNFPATKILMIIRDPVKSCESWALSAVTNNIYTNEYKKYEKITARMIIMLRDMNCLEFVEQDTVAVRLEDIKKNSKEAMGRLCSWLGIAESSSLYESTMQGLKWWGDPGSVLFGRTQTADHGKDEPIRRKSGIIFGKNDRFILETLFYPMSARFGYVREQQDDFIKDLQKIRPLLDKPLDFELKLSRDFPKDYPNLEKTVAYKSLHATMLGRWRILDKFGTYPHMPSPLP
ncbi:MAG: tetratricopeptide repeat protein [Magnetococcales bacterium]|nr:tetratricopeptide repeat protein [Magnetococcales bacterium]